MTGLADDPDTRSEAMRSADRANGEGDQAPLARCVVCGNRYDRTFEIRTSEGETFVFDSFECAVHRLAPRCGHCECLVIGHGTEVNGRIYCCAHCARASEDTDAPTDRVDEPVGH